MREMDISTKLLSEFLTKLVVNIYLAHAINLCTQAHGFMDRTNSKLADF